MLPSVLVAGDNAEKLAGGRLFSTKIRPLLATKCLPCHGGKPDDIKNGFDLRSRETTVVFLNFTLLVEPHTTVVVTLLLSALSVAGAVFLVLELNEPIGGLLQIPSDPMRMALDHLGK